MFLLVFTAYLWKFEQVTKVVVKCETEDQTKESDEKNTCPRHLEAKFELIQRVRGNDHEFSITL